MIPLTSVESSNVDAIGYDEDKQEMHVRFKNGGLYIYEGVPSEVHDRVTQASSIGRAIRQHCAGCYPFRRG